MNSILTFRKLLTLKHLYEILLYFCGLIRFEDGDSPQCVPYTFVQVLMDHFLGEMVTKTLKLFQDSHVQVRLAAFTLMEMPINFVQAAQLLYHHRFMHAFFIALGSDEDNKVKVCICSPINFMQNLFFH